MSTGSDDLAYCPRCETELVDGHCPRCPPALEFPRANLLHDIGELIELRPATTIANINAFLAQGWILLRIADASFTFLLGWRRADGPSRYPEWYEAERREREALLEALRVGESDELSLE